MTNFNVAMKQGAELHRLGRLQEASRAFQAAAALDASNPLPVLRQARCLRELGDAAGAEQAYRGLVGTHPDYPPGWSMLGVFLKDEGRYDEAIDVLTRSLSLEDNPEVRNTLVVSLTKSGRDEDARAEGLRNLVEKDRRVVAAFGASRWAGASIGRPRAPLSRRTPHKNIIAFSLWGDNPAYIHGAIVNARIAPHIYQGWTTRFYLDGSVPADAVNELRKAGAQIVRVDAPQLQPVRPMWRFLVSDDPGVDWFICRDADSRLNCQELLAVEDWLRSGASFHVMRDHLYHMELVLAGMWGGAAGVLPNIGERLLADNRYHGNRFADQAFLAEQVWPLIRESVVSHDSVFGFHNARPFPDAYRLDRPTHVGGAVKKMPHWR